VPRQGVMVEGVKGVKDTPMPPEMYENGKKMGSFLNFLTYKWLKMPFFAQKYLSRDTQEIFLKNT
jgi:hypothetical protein